MDKTICPVCGKQKVTIWKLDYTGMVTNGIAKRWQYHCENCGSGSKTHFSPIDMNADRWWGKKGSDI